MSQSDTSAVAELLRQCAEESLTGHCVTLTQGWRLCGRRLALQLLTASRSGAGKAEAAAREEQSAPTARAILKHRLALLAEVRPAALIQPCCA